MDDVDELFADLAGAGAAGEQMLGAVDLGVSEGSPFHPAGQEIGGIAERRIGGDARIAVRAAALQRQA